MPRNIRSRYNQENGDERKKLENSDSEERGKFSKPNSGS